MFTLNQINELHDRLGKRSTLFQYLQALNAIGVDKFDSFLTDGHSEYYGKDSCKVVSSIVHNKLPIAPKCNREEFLTHLKLHEQGKTDYFEMSKGLANSGIEKWTFDTHKMIVAYYDKDGNEILFEEIR